MLKPVSMQHIKYVSKLTRKTLRKCNIVMLIPMSMQHVKDVSTCVSVLCRPPSTFSVTTDVHTLSLSVSYHALYPLGPVATLRFCHLRPRCVSKQRRTTNVIISDRVWWIWCDAGLATVATRPQRSPHSVASNSRPDYFAATRSRSLFLTLNECCVSAAAAAIWEIQWRRSTPQLAPVDTGGQ